MVHINYTKYMMRRKDREMEKEAAYELLRTCEWGVLSLCDTLNPYALPISYAYQGDKIYFHGATEGTKIDIINKNPRALLVCVGKTKIIPSKFTTEYESVIVNGTISVIEDEKERRVGLQALITKYSPSWKCEGEEYIDSLFDKTAVAVLNIESITGKKR